MPVIYFSLIISYFVIILEGKMIPYIVDGEKANIADFPYVAHLATKCVDEDSEFSESWICGSSIINQHIILTAGHCVHGCFEETFITISVGQEYAMKNGVSTAHSYLVHENFDDETLSNDIALIRVEVPFKFNKTINRVALLKHPPYKGEALIAGWGLTNESARTESLSLRYTKQYVWDMKNCLDLFEWMPVGTFCAQNKKLSSFAAQGDSGSALVVQGYIQLGIVSGKNPEISASVAVYTDIGYFYDWIQENSRNIICEELI